MRTMLLAAAMAVGACTTAGKDVSVTTSSPLPTDTTATNAAVPTTGVVTFRSASEPVDAARLHASWRPGCPVSPERLRLVTIVHWGFDGAVHDGEVVVHEEYAEAIREVFRALFDARFPLEQVRLVDEFGGDDDRSMAANNTSAFNCRTATGSTRWSEHAYGRAIDLNPIQNPYVTRSGRVMPPEGSAYVERDDRPGVIVEPGPAVDAFTAIGWRWGGHWSSGKDYQHFSATGR